ncbi:hypothetical protein FS749_001734 [Ceratobasidium sp. UAMH 11750]|nr:hypothetical protein FS749_001734 [Ceratobasidium sp. UAMH 11750]
MYNLYRYQCYLYASCVWDIILDLARDNNDKNITYVRHNQTTRTNNGIKGPVDSIRGTNNYFQFLMLKPPIDPADRPEAVIIKYYGAWDEFGRNVETSKGKGSKSLKAHAEQESARADRESARAEQERIRADEEKARADQLQAKLAVIEQQMQELKAARNAQGIA